MRNPFRYFNSSPEVIRLTVMMYIRYPLSLRQVEDLLFERGIDICHETVQFWLNRFGPMFAKEIRKRRLHHRSYSQWRWHLDEVFVRINGETHYLWRAVDHEDEVLEVFATCTRLAELIATNRLLLEDIRTRLLRAEINTNQRNENRDGQHE
jgi:putative transposase